MCQKLDGLFKQGGQAFPHVCRVPIFKMLYHLYIFAMVLSQKKSLISSHLQLCDSLQVCPVDEVGNCEVEILAACGMVTSGGYSTASGAASPEIPGGLGSILQGLQWLDRVSRRVPNSNCCIVNG